MNVLYPGIGQAKQYRNSLIDWLSSFLPESALPPPPGMRNEMLTDQGTWRGAGQRVMNMLMPEPEDTMFGLMAGGKRFSFGKTITKDERNKILESIKDVYRENNLEKIIKGENIASGDPIWGYPHAPEYFIKSDITGSPIRHYVTLPDGKVAHPTELFPELSENTINKYIKDAENKAIADAKNAKYMAQQKDMRIIPSGTEDFKNMANYNYRKTNRSIENSTFMYNDNGDIVRVDMKDPKDVEYYISKGFNPK